MRAVVPDDLAGERADKVVAVLGGLSRRRARELIEQGKVRGEEGPVRPSDRLSGGAAITFEVPPPEVGLQAEVVPFQVRYEDDDLLVVEKPAGVVVHPGAGRPSGSLAAGLLHRYPEIEGVGEAGRWGIVHRLDRETSGLLVVARSRRAYGPLTRALREHRIVRTYLALVRGLFDLPLGTVDASLDRDPARPTRFRVAATGRPARTHYHRIEEWDPPGVSLLEVRLETGRTHQIRVHLASIAHAVIGDRVYGVGPDPVSSPRLFLHAAGIELDHPISGIRLEAASPLPADLEEVLDGLGERGGAG